MVPTLTCGLVRSNFSFAMIYPIYVSRKQNLVPAPVGTGTALLLTATCADDFLGNVIRSLGVLLKLHAVGCTADRKSTRLNSSHVAISYAVFCLKKKRVMRQDQHSMPHDLYED